MSTTERSFLCGWVAALTLSTAEPAHAYLDPGTGSMVLQIILGGIAGVGVALKLYWRRLRDRLGFTRRHASARATDARKPD